MISIVDRLFPEDDMPNDVLLGMPDDAQGNAARFFNALNEADREIVQHYVQNFIPPVSTIARDCESYVTDLVAGYAVVDPTRRSVEGVASALSEIERVWRYLEIFTESDGYFPWIVSQTVCLTDDITGELVILNEKSWEDIAQATGFWSTDFFREEAIQRVMPVVDEASKFIQDPTGSILFDQDYILYKRESIAWLTGNEPGL